MMRVPNILLISYFQKGLPDKSEALLRDIIKRREIPTFLHKFRFSSGPLKFHSLFFSSDVQFFFQKVLLEHSYQPHDTILENQKPKRCGYHVVHVDSLWFMDMALVALPENRAEVDQIGYDIMQQRCGCACIWKYHYLTSHDISSSYESLLWGMRFDFSSPQKDNAFMKERSGLLEEENKNLHDELFVDHAKRLKEHPMLSLSSYLKQDELWESGQIKSNSWEKALVLLSDGSVSAFDFSSLHCFCYFYKNDALTALSLQSDLGCWRKRTSSFVMGSLVKLGDLEEAKAVLDDWTSTCYTYDFRVPDILLTGYWGYHDDHLDSLWFMDLVLVALPEIRGFDSVAKSLSHLSNKLETALELTKYMARRAASKARELKWIRWDMAFKQERSGLLEEENKKLRDGLFGKAWRSRRSKAVLDDWTSTCHTYDFAEHTADGILSKGAIDLPRHLLLEHSYQLHAMIVENKKPKKVALPEIRLINLLPTVPQIVVSDDDLAQLSYLNEPSVLHNLLCRYLQENTHSIAEVDQIGYDIMQQRCGCACIWKYHHLTSHDISSSYESLLWGMRFDFSSPQKGVEDESFNFRQPDFR
ncbi:hypothetical protein SASPL_150402 [Salvia splendens]|uniref:Uncharacterized protein n=1 Tax=Salvia splendens TaxID=180675 RepID=A0A8X8W5Z6_SALSN|nr:hypothetical protein SASPL_150402 [Salvia splendens]